MTGLLEQEATQDRTQHVVEGLTGWHGQGLSNFAQMIADDPHLEGKTFGEIGSPDHPTVHGYTQHQLAGVLERWELELSGTEKKTGGHLFDRPHWELASLEAVKAMAGKSREPLSTTINSRITTLQETLMESRTGIKKNNAMSQDIVPVEKKSIPWIPREMRRVQAQQKAADVLSTAGSVVYAVVKRPYLVLPVLALAACSAFGGKTESTQSPISSPPMTETIPAPTTTSPPAETPDPLAGAPEGATDKINGEWIKEVTENGKTNTFVWTEKTDALTGEIVFSGWTREITDKEGIPVIDFKRDEYGTMGKIQLFVSDEVVGGQNLPSFIHTNINLENAYDDTLMSKVGVSLYKRTHEGNNPDGTQINDFYSDMLGKDNLGGTVVHIDFFTSDSSEIQKWFIGPKRGTKVFITNWNSLEGVPDITNNPIGISLRSKILGVDTDGNLMGVIATNISIDTLTEEQWWEIILWHTASVVDREDQTQQYFNSTLASWLAFAKNQNGDPWIEQGPNN